MHKKYFSVATILLVALTPLGCEAQENAPAAPAQTKEQIEEQLKSAKPLAEEKIGRPVQTMPLYRDTWVPNPDGKGWTRLFFYHDGASGIPNQTVAVNTATGAVKKFVLNNVKGAPWRWTIGHDGKAYLGHYGSAAIWMYDPVKETMEFFESDIKPATTVSSISTGTDGKIYAGTTPKIITFQFDPATRKFTSYGIQGEERQYLGYGYSVAADDEWVYTAAGKMPWQLIAHNKATGEQKVLLEADANDYLGVEQRRYGCVAQHIVKTGPEAGTTKRYWLFQGRAILITDPNTPPWPVPATEPARLSRPEENVDNAVPGADSKAVYWWRTPEARAKAPKTPPEGARAEDLGWQKVEFELEVTPSEITFLREMPDGRLIGVGPSYQDWFLVNPQDNKIELLGKIPLSHYDTVFVGGKVYMMGYPNTPLYVYDPSRPWTAGRGTPTQPAPPLDDPRSNPQRVKYFNTILNTHHARAGAVGADGKIYLGAHAERSHVGGGLGWWDPKTGEAGGLREPFELYDVLGLAATDGGKKIVYSSYPVKDPKTGEHPSEAKLFVYDVEKQQLSHSFAPYPGSRTAARLMSGPGTTVIGVLPGISSKVYVADVAAQKVLREYQFSFRLVEHRIGPDGVIWGFAEQSKTLVRIDPTNLSLETIGTTVPGSTAFAGNDIYLGGGTELRLVRGVASR